MTFEIKIKSKYSKSETFINLNTIHNVKINLELMLCSNIYKFSTTLIFN